MSKSKLTSRFIYLRCLHHQLKPSRPPKPPFPSFSHHPIPKAHFSSSRIFDTTTLKLNPQPRNFIGVRYFSINGSGSGSKLMNAGVVIRAIKDPAPAAVVKSTFWNRNALVLLGLLVCLLPSRVIFGTANTFSIVLSVSEDMAKYGFLALSTAIVAFAGLYLRSRFTINPEKVYRMGMRRLKTSAGILEVMGAPLTRLDLIAYIRSGQDIPFRNFEDRMLDKLCFLIFPFKGAFARSAGGFDLAHSAGRAPTLNNFKVKTRSAWGSIIFAIQGSERKGLVSIEVKKNKGQYDMKLLAVDIPMETGPDQRLFLIGNQKMYRSSVISVLRDPLVDKVSSAVKEFEDGA